MGFSLGSELTHFEPSLPRIDWEETACPLCGGTESAPKLEAPAPAGPTLARRFLIVECRHCGLCFTNPRPTADCLARLYPPPLPPIAAPSPRRGARDGLDPLLEHGCLLDFGYGIGSFLHRLRARGRPFMAVNLSPAATDFLRDRWHVNALAGTLPHPELTGQAFDTLTCVDVLQHVPRPLEVLRAARDLLVPGGMLIVAVPNFDSLPRQWFGANWAGLNVPRHLCHFTPRTLRLLLHHADFRLQRLIAVRHSSWLRHSARRAAWSWLLPTKATASLAGWYTALLRRANGMVAIAVR